MAPKPDKSKNTAAGGKGKGKGKGQSKGKDDGSAPGGGSGKLKAAQSINVRHILVGESKSSCLLLEPGSDGFADHDPA